MDDPSRPASWQPPDAAGAPPAPTGLPAPPVRSFDPPPGFGEQPLIQPAGSGTPFWRRWWVLLVIGLVVAAGVVAAVGRDDEAGETDEPAATTADAEPGPAPDDEADSGPATTLPAAAEPSSETDDAGQADTTPEDDAAPDEGSTPNDETADDDTAGDDTAGEGETDNGDAGPAAGSIELPYAIGEPVVITVDGFGDADGSVWTLTVDGPGALITDDVLAHNQFNDPPRDGHGFYGVPITLTLYEAGKEPLSTFLNIDPEYFLPVAKQVVSNALEDGCGVVPGDFEALQEVFVGGSISGMLCYSVPVEEVDVGVFVTLDEIEQGRVFIATEPGIGVAATDTPPDLPSPLEVGGGPLGSRSNPIPVGESAGLTLDTFGDADGSSWTLTVTGPGGDITADVLAENPFNDEPPEGHVFYGVPVSLTLDQADKEPLSMVGNTQLEYFTPVSLGIIGAVLIEGCGVVPDGIDVFQEVFAGGTINGTVCFAVPVDDVAAGVQLTLDEIEQGRLFFAT